MLKQDRVDSLMSSVLFISEESRCYLIFSVLSLHHYQLEGFQTFQTGSDPEESETEARLTCQHRLIQTTTSTPLLFHLQSVALSVFS